MSHNSFEIKEGALLIADAHYSEHRGELLELIERIHAKKILPSQLILMGDIFDALFGGVSYTEKKNRKMIRLINEISSSMEVLYLEGNHDFNLHEYFHSLTVVPQKAQPLVCSLRGKKVALAHGDFDGNFSYRLYCSIIRNRGVVKLLTLFDTLFAHPILKKLDAYLLKKEDCREFVGFMAFIERRRLERYGCEVFIEGHYHQNKQFKFENFTYINLGAFACNQRYFVVKSSQHEELLEEKRLS